MPNQTGNAMGNEFSGLPMGELIGAPLTAACDAQIRLAQATANFINTVGFDDKGGVRQVDFSFWRPAKKTDSDPADGPPKVEKVMLSVPFLAILNIPALKIKSVDITFDMEVKTSESSTDSRKADVGFEAGGSFGVGPFSMSVKVNGSISTAKENTRKTDKSAKYHVEVHALDEGMPEGLSRVLDILNSAVAPVAIGKPEDAAAGKGLPAPAKPDEQAPANS